MSFNVGAWQRRKTRLAGAIVGGILGGAIGHSGGAAAAGAAIGATTAQSRLNPGRRCGL